MSCKKTNYETKKEVNSLWIGTAINEKQGKVLSDNVIEALNEDGGDDVKTIEDALLYLNEKAGTGGGGAPGKDGFSPTVSINKVDKQTTVTITDKSGEHTATINDGIDGQPGTNGQDGVSPTVAVSKTGKVTTVTITDKTGAHTATINDGTDGTNGTDGQPGAKGDKGEDGVSPTVAVERVTGGVKVTITDKNGSHSAVLNDGIGDGSTVATFADVPSDGKSYLRQNGTWVEGATKEELNAIGAKVGEFSQKAENISTESATTEEDAIVITTDAGVQVGKIDESGADFKNLKSNGKDVLTEHQDISQLATKTEVNKKQDTLIAGKNITISDDGKTISAEGGVGDLPITKESATSEEDNIEFTNDSGKPIMRVTPEQVMVEKITDMNGNPIGGGSSALSNQEIRKIQFAPDYYAYFYGKRGSWYERFRLMHFSDTHSNTTNLIEAVSIAKDMVDVIVDTGDNSNGLPTSSSAGIINELNIYTTKVKEANISGVRMNICAGNHDVPNLTKRDFFEKISNLVATYSNDYVFGDADNYRTYGYMDITPNTTIGTIRIITLDPFDYDDGQFMNPYGLTGRGGWMNCVFSQKQINWLITTLRDSVSNGIKVITAMHYSFGDNTSWQENGVSANPDANYHQDPFMIPDIIDAMQKKSVLFKTYQDDCNINNITINEDFSSIGNLHYICHLFGHIHSKNNYQCQKTDGSKKYDMLMLGEHNMGSKGVAINKVKLHPDTINSIKLSVLEIDTLEQCIYRVSYGGFKAYDMSETERTTKINYRFNQ